MQKFFTHQLRFKLFSKTFTRVVCFFSALSFMMSVEAQNYTTTTFTDPVFTTVNNATGVITAGAGVGLISLRSALKAADNAGGAHIITLLTGTYVLDGSTSYTVPSLGTFSSRTLFFGNSSQNITINGNGTGNTIVNMAATGRDRIMTINYDGVVNNVFTTINGVKFTNGYLTYDTYGGAAIYAGPAYLNIQTLTLSNCAFDNNICPTSGGSGGIGGAIYMYQGTLNIDNCAFTNNKSVDGNGGAIHYRLQNNDMDNGVLNITNSSFSANVAGANGGAVDFLAQGYLVPQTFAVDISKNTFTSNGAKLGGAIFANNALNVSVPAINFNRFVGNTASVDPASGAFHFSESAGSINADNNWWGCNSGPAAGPCDRAGGDVAGGGALILTKWLQLKTTASPTQICTGATSAVTSGFLSNSASEAIAPANLTALIGRPITFSASLGTLSGAQPTIQASGTATVTYTAGGTGGSGSVNAVVDNVPAADATAKATIFISKPVVVNPATSTGTVTIPFSQTFTANSGVAPYTFSTSSTLPGGLSLSSGGVLSGTPTQTGTFPIIVNVTDNITCTGSGSTYNLVIACQTITVTAPGVTTGTVGTPFSQSFTQTNAQGGATFTLNTGTLPTGLTLSAAGLLSGTPTQFGSFPITVKVTDGANACTGISSTYTLVISCQTITVTNPGVAAGTNGTAFSQTFTQVGALGGATFTLNSGSLPSGLTLSAGGVLSGTPNAAAGTYPITVKVTDGNGCTGTGATYNLVISCPTITVTNPVVTAGQLNIAFSETFTSSGGTGPYTYTTGSTLPAGITLSSAGVLSGTPTATGTFPITVDVKDANLCAAASPLYTLVITACPVNDQTVTALPTTICTGSSSTITVGASQPGVNYTLRLDPSNTVVAGPTASNGPAINFNTGALAGTTTYNVLAETDKYSINLNGGQAGFTIPEVPALALNNNFTIEGWIKPAGNGSFARLFNKDQSYALGISGGQGQITFTAHNHNDYSLPFTFNNGVWYHIACTFASNNVEFFVNGVSLGTVPAVSTPDNSAFGSHIGSDGGGTVNQFNGNIDNVRVWNSVRSQAQIAANQNAFLTSTGNPNLVASWWIIEGSGNAKDYSANAIDATALDGTWQVDAPVASCSIVLTTKPTVTVNLNNTITLASAPGTNAQTVCINTAITNITYNTSGATGATFSGLPAGVTGTWAANVVTISGSPTTTVGSPFNYTVNLTGGCGTISATGSIAVNPANTIALTSIAGTDAQTVCINTPITNITYSTGGATGATFSGLPAGVTGSWAANVVTISGTPTGSGTFNYTVTETGGCPVTANGIITVTANNTIVLNSAPGTNAQTVCINTAITNITYNTTGATGATFSGLPAGVNGSWVANVVTISGSPNTTVGSPFSYTVTLTGGCGTITANGTIAVNPNNTMSLISAPATTNQTVLVNTPITNVTYSTMGATGATFSGLPTGVTGSWAANTVTISGTPTVLGTFNYTISLTGGCGAITANGTIDVVACSITRSSAAGTDAQTVCNNTAITNITYATTGATGASFTGLPAGVTGAWAANVATISGTPSVAGTFGYVVTLTGGGCGAFNATGSITVNPTPTVTQPANQVVCNNAATVAVNFTGSVPGSVFNWTNSDPSIGLAASGTGDIASFNAINTGTTPVVATVTVTPSTTSGGGGPVTQNFNYTGAIQTWTVPAGVTSLIVTANGAQGGDGGGLGVSITGTVTVVPGEVLSIISGGMGTLGITNVNGGGGGGGSYVVRAGNIPLIVAGGGGGRAEFGPALIPAISNGQTSTNGGSTFGGGGGTGGNGGSFGIGDDVLPGNKGGSGGGGFFTNGLNGPPNSTGGNAYVNNSAGGAGAGVIPGYPTNGGNGGFGGGGGAAYDDVVRGGGGGGYSGGQGGVAYEYFHGGGGGSFNSGSAQVNTAGVQSGNGFVTITYTAGITCTGPSKTFTITVNPTPNVTATPVSQTICSGSAIIPIVNSGAVSGTVYNWTRDNPIVTGIVNSGTGNISGTLTNATNTPITVTFTITPSYTNGGQTCLGTPVTATVVVNPTPDVNQPANQVVCNGGLTAAVNFTGSVTAPPGTVYTWTNNTPGIGLAAGPLTGNIASFTAINNGTAPVTATITVTPSYTNGGTTCTGSSKTFTITVNPTPVAVVPANAVVCNGTLQPTGTYNFTTTATGGVTTYTWSNNNINIGLGGVGAGNSLPTFTATNNTTAPITGTITVTPTFTNGGVSCTGPSNSFTITVNPTPNATAAPTSQIICTSTPITTIVLTGTVPGTVFNWTRDNGTLAGGPVSGIAASGSGNISGTLNNTQLGPVMVTFTITPSYTNGGVTCTGPSVTATVTVNPVPNVTVPANQIYCNGTTVTTGTLNFTSTNTPAGTTVFTWTNDNINIGLGASGNGQLPTFTTTNATPGPIVGTIVVTPHYTNAGGGPTCDGPAQTFTITVNPIPNVTVPVNQIYCNGTTVTTGTLNFTSTNTPAGTTVFTWTNSNTNIGLGANGTGQLPTFTTTNATLGPITGTIVVTPHYTNAGGGPTCDGPAQTFTITVNPTPNVTVPANQVYCNNTTVTTGTLNFTSTNTPAGTTVFTWTNSNTNIGLGASGAGNSLPTFTTTNPTNGPITGIITVTPHYTNAGGGPTCDGPSQTFTITVNPTATVNPVANQTVCTGSPTAAVTFSSPTTGGTIVYNWTNTNPTIGLVASGIGNIPSFIGLNITNAPNAGTIVVTPTYTSGGVSCVGIPISFTITINPVPVVNPVPNQTVCNGAPTTSVVFASPTTGGIIVYNWTNSNTAIGLGALGVGDIPSFIATNPGTAPISGTITVTPTYTNNGVSCTGPAITFTITVNPTPTVNPVANQVVCNNTPTAAVTFTGAVPGTVYTWTNTGAFIGLGPNGVGNIPSFIATNPGNVPLTATITVTPTYTGGGVSCSGAPVTFTITVNPTPTVNQPVNQVLCNGSPTAAVTFTGTVVGTVYTWTNNNITIGLGASGTGNIPSFIATNAGTTVQTATIVVTPTYTNGGVSCTGASKSFTITVNPIPTVNAIADLRVCSGTLTAVTFTGATAGTVYNWTNNNTAIGLPASGAGNLNFIATNTSAIPIFATITVTPSFTNGGVTCTGASKSFVITVNPTPTADQQPNQVLCNGSPTTAITFTGSASGAFYTWTNNQPSIGLGAFGAGDIPSFIALNAGTAPVVATVTVTPVFIAGGVTCTGPTMSFTITVNPTPSVNAIANQILCSGSTTTAVTITGPVAGTVYNWTNNNISIGLAASGTATVPAFVAINNTNAAVTATITVTPIYTNAGVTCSGTPISFTITVNPKAVVNQPADQLLCNGSNTTTVIFTGLPPGSTYSWTNNNTSIGLAASGTGNIASFAATNATNTVQTATITVTPSSTGCVGLPVSFTITVNPTPTVNQPANQTVCAGTSTAAVPLSGAVAGTVYTWTNNNTSIGLGASGTGTVPAFVTVNPTVSAITATITVTPTYTNGGISCTGASKTFTITVNPLPNIVFDNVPPRVCLTDTIVILKATPLGGTWSGVGVSGNTFSATAAGLGVKTLSYTSTNVNGCTQTSYVNITVNDCAERHNIFANAIRIYPNPNGGRFNIRFNSDVYSEFNVRVIDAAGRVYRNQKITGLRYGSVIPMNMSDLASGTYFLQIYNESERAEFPLVIVR